MNGKARGFTLIELMITISIAAILLGVGVPSMRNMILNNQRAAVVNSTMAGFQLARAAAFTRGNPVHMCTSNALANPTACDSTREWTDSWFVFEDANANDSFDPGEPVLMTGGNAPADFSITAHSGGPANKDFRFTRRGATSDSLALCVNGQKRRIVVDSSGQIRLERDTC